jgi:hypothetical protein
MKAEWMPCGRGAGNRLIECTHFGKFVQVIMSLARINGDGMVSRRRARPAKQCDGKALF